MATEKLQKKRREAQTELTKMTHSRDGAQKVATYFIASVSWAKLVQAFEDLKE